MPAAIPLIAAGAGFLAAGEVATVLGVAVGSFTLGGVISGLAGFVVSTAVNAIGSRAFASSPKQGGSSAESARAISTMVRSSIESHKIVYGQMRVSGPIVLIQTTDSGPDEAGAIQTGTNKFLHIVIALAGHEVEEIGTIYLNDTAVTLDGSGWVSSAPYSRTVEATNTVSYDIVSIVVSGYSSKDGTSTGTVTTTTPHGFTVGQRVATTSLRKDTVTIVSVPSATTFTYDSTAQNGTQTGGFVTRDVVTTNSVSFIRVKKHLGTTTQTADTDLVNECALTANFRLQGIAYLYVRMEFNPDVFPQGIPNVSAVVKGKKVYDPRTTLTAWSANVALCIRDYMTSDYGFNCDTDEINDTYFGSAANACDEAVTLTTGGTQSRYTCNGVIDTASAPLDNLNAMVAAMAGAVTYVQGQFRAHAGAYDSPAGAITEDMLAGSVKLRTRTTRQELFNAVQGTYVDPNKNWQPTDFPPVTNSTYEAQDGGERIAKDIVLTLTNHPEAAQRIGKVILEQGRQGLQLELPLNHNALGFAVFDTVTYTSPALGWSSKVFRIKKLTTQGIGPIVLSLQEESSASYDWNSGQATTIDAAPDTNLPDPFTVVPPGAIAINESLYITRNGDGVKAQAELTWLPSTDIFLKEYQPEYKLTGDDVYTRLTRTDGTTSVILDIEPGTYDVRVKAINTLGVSSAYTYYFSKQISGLLAPPIAPQNLAINTIGGLALLRWQQSPDLDVKIGGSFLFRHSSQTGGPGWNESVSIGDPVPGAATSVALPLKPGTYMVRAQDSSGVQSTSYSSVETTQATVLTYSPLEELVEDPVFSGTKTSCFVDESNVLQIMGAGNIDDEPDFDAIPSFDATGGVQPSATYAFSAVMDLGSVKKVRLTSHIKSIIQNVFDLIDSRAEDVDTWPTFDGGTDALADATLSVDYMQADPATLPPAVTVAALEQGEFEARAFRFTLTLHSYSTSHNIFVSELSVTAEELA